MIKKMEPNSIFFDQKKCWQKKIITKFLLAEFATKKKVFLVENLEFGSIPVALCGDLEKNDHTIF